MLCRSCADPLAPDADDRRLFCSQRCRQRAYRARETARLAAAHDLVMRQTRAILNGDLTALDQVRRDAERLFAPTS